MAERLHSTLAGAIQKHEIEPRIVSKEKRDKKAEAHRVEVKRAVWKRDKGRCRCCGGDAQEMHEIKFRSLGGKRSLENSIAVCTFKGQNCHRLLQQLVVRVTFREGWAQANGLLEFERDGRVWTSRPGERIQRDRRSWQRD